MPNPDTELLFPPRIIPDLESLRDGPWRSLVRRVAAAPAASPDRTAFVLLMVRLNNCAACHTGSYRALQGCTHCSRQNILRRKESDEELVALFDAAKKEVDASEVLCKIQDR
ncbi:MAG: hypothetical protein AB1846_15925 [Chloroflexota bacterium]